jgi:phosphonate transport system permease protein
MEKKKVLSPDIFVARQRSYLLSFLVIALIILLANRITGFKFFDGLSAFPVAAKWMAVNLIPNGEALKRLPDILKKLFQTVLISIMATSVAAGLAFLLAILGSRATRPVPVLAVVVRLIASFFRNIPVAAWAMIFLFSFGQSDITGFLAIFVETFGFLVRAFLETIDETAADGVEALRSSGATWTHTVAQAVLPSATPQVVSWMLYMIETNIRSATLVGILTGTGIGFAFSMFYRRMNYPAAGLTTLSIVVVVLAIEALSNRIRRIIL